MNRYYGDILSRVSENPRWFDEHAVPRFDEFAPSECADIYAREVLLLRIECQACGREFDVCMSQSNWHRYLDGVDHKALSERVVEKTLHYGDPPNVRCCACGPTMNSVPRRVLSFFKREKSDWIRHSELEVTIDDENYGEESPSSLTMITDDLLLQDYLP